MEVGVSALLRQDLLVRAGLEAVVGECVGLTGGVRHGGEVGPGGGRCGSGKE